MTVAWPTSQSLKEMFRHLLDQALQDRIDAALTSQIMRCRKRCVARHTLKHLPQTP